MKTTRVLFAASFLAVGACGEKPTTKEPRAGTTQSPNRDDVRASAATTDLPLVPRPRQISTCSSAFAPDARTILAVTDTPEALAIGAKLGAWLGLDASQVRALPKGAPLPDRSIVLWVDRPEGREDPRDPSRTFPSNKSEESFVLDVDAARVLARAPSPEGLFYAAQTIAALAGARPLQGAQGATDDAKSSGPRPIPCAHVEDAPANRVRAMHLDVARHFFPREVVERYIDLLAFYRFNVFHWHLTDDQGFRLALSSHPELTAIGARRVEDGVETSGHYTPDDVRAIVAYAKERFITVVPEIEMPGHARAILAAHPELSCTGKKLEVPTTWGVFDEVLCAGNDATHKLLDDVIGEVASLFPSQVVHLGGDEVPTTHWQSCAKCRALMKKENVDVGALQGVFMRKVAASLANHGRRTMAWDEALDGGLPESGIVVAWQNPERGALAARAGHDVVMAPNAFTYFDRAQSPKRSDVHESILPWTTVLGFDPIPTGLTPEEEARVVGGEGALWTERVKTVADLDTRAMPRMAALAEALWSAPKKGSEREVRNAEVDFAARFRAQRPMLDRAGVAYFVEPPMGLSTKKVFVDRATLTLAAPLLYRDGTVRFTLDGSEPTASSPAFTAAVPIEATTTVRARLFLPNGRTSEIATGVFEKQTPAAAVPSMGTPMRQGVAYTYFEGAFERVPNFERIMKPMNVRTGVLPAPSFDEAFRAEHFAVAYRGFVDVPKTGVYRFVARADDGVIVDVDGARVVDDDGKHAPRDAEGEIALAAGLHAVRIGYFQGGHGKELSLTCEGPGLSPGPCVLFTAAQ